MSFLDVLKDTLNLVPLAPTTKIIIISSGANYAELPQGFFRVETRSGKQTLGYNGGFLSWDAGDTVVDGGRRITLDTPKAELPLVKLNFSKQRADGIQQVGGRGLVDTDVLDDNDGTVAWAGQTPRDGVSTFERAGTSGAVCVNHF
jgi:hypothetical protein